MIWLVSYPRSGNTFFRNVLHDVYDVDSGVCAFPDDLKDYQKTPPFKVLKTHLLPQHVPLKSDDIVVYLLRDGRDSIVSQGYQMANITKKGSDFTTNVDKILMTSFRSDFGSWASNVQAWKSRKNVLIKFEDLIEDPITQVEKLREHMEMNKPNLDRLPTFDSQKSGKSKFKGRDASVFFRKGKVGDWITELSRKQRWFIENHFGSTLEEFDYDLSNSSNWIYSFSDLNIKYQLLKAAYKIPFGEGLIRNLHGKV